MITPKQIILSLACLLVFGATDAQAVRVDTIKRAETEETITNKGHDQYQVEYNPTTTDNYDVKPQANVLKTSALNWISGVIPLYYERRVAPFLSLQFGLGLTTRDFIADAISDLRTVFTDYSPQDYNNYAFYGTQGRHASVGVYASFQPKFFPRRKALSHFFVSPMIEFKRFDFRAQYANPIAGYNDDPVYSTTTMTEHRDCIDFTVNVGRQWFLGSGVSLEIMGGVGFQKNMEYRRDIEQAYVTGSYGNYGYTTTTRFFSNYRPEFNLNLLVGGFF